ncbi:MAG: RHS repeat-associated core domain-containing protein [Pirellulaceae bacterium]
MHRWYDNHTGRWISEDPIGFAAGDANLTRYVGNHVTSSTDTFGLAEDLIVKANVLSVDLRITFTLGLDPVSYDLCLNSLVETLAKDGGGLVLDKAKEKLWEVFLRQLSGRGQDLITFLKEIAKDQPVGKKIGAEKVYLNSWSIRPVYTMEYATMYLCHEHKTGRFTAIDISDVERVEIVGRPIHSNEFSNYGKIDLTSDKDRRVFMRDAKNAFGKVGRIMTLDYMHGEAEFLLRQYVKSATDHKNATMLVTIDGLYSPKSDLTSWGDLPDISTK